MNKVIISADSTCDIGTQLQREYDIQLVHNHISLDGKEYIDTVDISPEDIFKKWEEKKVLPYTSAINPADYYAHFQPFVDAGNKVVHICIGSGLSSSYQNCMMVAEDLDGIYPVDSSNLSAGIGLLVIKAAEMAEAGMDAEEIQTQLEDMRDKSHSSFLLDTLDFMKAGGRCSSVTALGANMLQIKPCIQVDNEDSGKMHMGKKYRGSMDKAINKYVHATLEGRDDLDLDRIFVTHSGSPQHSIDQAIDSIRECSDFKDIYVTTANGTISSHCGPGTLGILYMTQ